MFARKCIMLLLTPVVNSQQEHQKPAGSSQLATLFLCLSRSHGNNPKGSPKYPQLSRCGRDPGCFLNRINSSRGWRKFEQQYVAVSNRKEIAPFIFGYKSISETAFYKLCHHGRLAINKQKGKTSSLSFFKEIIHCEIQELLFGPPKLSTLKHEHSVYLLLL